MLGRPLRRWGDGGGGIHLHVPLHRLPAESCPMAEWHWASCFGEGGVFFFSLLDAYCSIAVAVYLPPVGKWIVSFCEGAKQSVERERSCFSYEWLLGPWHLLLHVACCPSCSFALVSFVLDLRFYPSGYTSLPVKQPPNEANRNLLITPAAKPLSITQQAAEVTPGTRPIGRFFRERERESLPRQQEAIPYHGAVVPVDL